MKEVTLLTNSPFTLALSGVIDSGNAEEFYAAVRAYYGQSDSDIVFSCEKLEFLDSTALGTFVKILKFVRMNGHGLKLTGLNPRLKKLFVICALDKIMEIE